MFAPAALPTVTEFHAAGSDEAAEIGFAHVGFLDEAVKFSLLTRERLAFASQMVDDVCHGSTAAVPPDAAAHTR
jgi:hypothetical protein